MNNYLEKLRFTLLLDNLNNKSVNPTIFLGIDKDTVDFYTMNAGENKIIFDAVIYDAGIHSVWFKVDNTKFANDISSIIVKDLKIHGTSVTYNIFQCIYYPEYTVEHLQNSQSLPSEIKSSLYVGNNGVWKWFFDSPIYENKKYKIGLW